MSRGRVVMEALKHDNVASFVAHFSCVGIEPFTLLIRDASTLTELHWNGDLLDVVGLDPQQPHIWASWTLYDRADHDRRQQWFAAWLADHAQPTAEDLARFHREAGDGNRTHNVRMYRSAQLMTISISTIACHAQSIELICRSLLTGRSMQERQLQNQ